MCAAERPHHHTHIYKADFEPHPTEQGKFTLGAIRPGTSGDVDTLRALLDATASSSPLGGRASSPFVRHRPARGSWPPVHESSCGIPGPIHPQRSGRAALADAIR